MTTELVLLLCLTFFVSAAAMFGDKGPINVFKNSSPRLGARLEQNIAIGHQFKVRNFDGGQLPTAWKAPSSKAPTGQL